jgi:hypothetical protein
MIAASKPISQAALNRAEAFLRKHLAGGPVRSNVIVHRALEVGIPRRTLDAAKARVARSFRSDNEPGNSDRSGWYMELADDAEDGAF